jgi:hypothetical protein
MFTPPFHHRASAPSSSQPPAAAGAETVLRFDLCFRFEMEKTVLTSPPRLAAPWLSLDPSIALQLDLLHSNAMSVTGKSFH